MFMCFVNQESVINLDLNWKQSFLIHFCQDCGHPTEANNLKNNLALLPEPLEVGQRVSRHGNAGQPLDLSPTLLKSFSSSLTQITNKPVLDHRTLTEGES